MTWILNTTLIAIASIVASTAFALICITATKDQPFMRIRKKGFLILTITLLLLSTPAIQYYCAWIVPSNYMIRVTMSWERPETQEYLGVVAHDESLLLIPVLHNPEHINLGEDRSSMSVGYMLARFTDDAYASGSLIEVSKGDREQVNEQIDSVINEITKHDMCTLPISVTEQVRFNTLSLTDGSRIEGMNSNTHIRHDNGWSTTKRNVAYWNRTQSAWSDNLSDVLFQNTTPTRIVIAALYFLCLSGTLNTCYTKSEKRLKITD